jgi:putative dehydrogenase
MENQKAQSVGVIGLGSMGMGAANSCIRAGLDVYGIDLNTHALEVLKKPNTAIMVSATIAADDAKQIEAKLKEYQLIMLDAPVSGGAIKAEAGEMTIMASGSKEAFDKLEPVLEATASKVYNIGEEIGLGATVKIIHQLLAGVHIAAGAEAMALAARANIPLDLMYDVVTNAAGNSWMFENRMKHVVDGDYSPKSMVDIFVIFKGIDLPGVEK